MSDIGYVTRVTHMRIWHDNGEWFLDAADEDGNYTESCWSYDTYAEAVAAVDEFVKYVTDPYNGDYRVVFYGPRHDVAQRRRFNSK